MKPIEKILNQIIQPLDEKIKSEIEEYLTAIYENKSSLKQLLKSIEKTNWKKLLTKFDENYNELYSSFNLSKPMQGIYGNKIFFKRKLLEEFRNKLLLEYLINGNIKNANRTIEYFFSQYKAQHLIERMKLDESNKLLEAKDKISNKFIGKKYNVENLKIYGLIFQKNDEFIERNKASNFRLAASNVIKYGNFESKNKSFNKFKNTNKIITYKQFENFLSTIRK